MIQDGTNVRITDNSGGTLGRVFKVLGGSKRRYAGIGDIVIISVKVASPRKAVKKKDIHQAVVVRQKNALRRKDGSYIRFDDNAVVILEKGKQEPKITWRKNKTEIKDTPNKYKISKKKENDDTILCTLDILVSFFSNK
jgi:large subunit ribosomal protein L14